MSLYKDPFKFYDGESWRSWNVRAKEDSYFTNKDSEVLRSWVTYLKLQYETRKNHDP